MRKLRFFGLSMVVVFAAGCGTAQPAPSPSVAASKPAAAAGAPAASAPAASVAAKPAASAVATAKPAASGQAVKLRFPYTSPSAAFVPQWVALEQGIFLKHSLDVTVSYMETNTVSPALIAGEIDVSPTPSAINIMLSGGDAVLIANLLSAPVFSLYSTSEVNSVKDLKDKVVGDTPQGSAPDGALRALLAKNGLNPAVDV